MGVGRKKGGAKVTLNLSLVFLICVFQGLIHRSPPDTKAFTVVHAYSVGLCTAANGKLVHIDKHLVKAVASGKFIRNIQI